MYDDLHVGFFFFFWSLMIFFEYMSDVTSAAGLTEFMEAFLPPVYPHGVYMSLF